MEVSSTPNLLNFAPLPQQYEIIKDVRRNYDYSAGTHEFLLSGSVGSSKSLTLAHLIATHCVMYPGAHVGLGRLHLPDLKGTLCQKLREHLYNTGGGLEYRYNESTGNFSFNNGSRCTAFSWGDKKYQKFRSQELSAMAIEELSENKGDHWQAYIEAFQRVGRLSHVPEKWIGCATNPDSPSHPAYEHFMEKSGPTRRVYYSRTDQNPYLPKAYIKNLLDTLDPREARRMVYGEWVEISDEVIYYCYSRDENFINEHYKPNPKYPVCIAFDFNIALNKPLSIAFLQHINGQVHVYNQIAIQGLRTNDALLEAEGKGLLPQGFRYIVHGDAAGRHNDTRSNQSDYSIIQTFLSKLGLHYEMQVPLANPAIKFRHNKVNAKILNANGTRNLFVYKDAPMADKGFRLTALKAGAHYNEDDSKEFQHITTAIGYSICSYVENVGSGVTMLSR